MWEQIQWGTAGEWVGGIGTVGALTVSIWLAWRAHGEATEARLSARRAQASRVMLTVRYVGGPAEDEQPTGTTRSETWLLYYAVHNRSDLPIIDVKVASAAAQPHRGGVDELGALLPDARFEGVLGIAVDVPIDSQTEPDFSASVTFTDAAGVRWRRGDDFSLTGVRT